MTADIIEICIFGPISEEWFFRAILYLWIVCMFAKTNWEEDIFNIFLGKSSPIKFDKTFNKEWIFLISSSILFSLAHLFFNAYPSHFLYYFIIGVILGLIFLRYGVLFSILGHSLYNLWIITFIW